MLFKEELFKRSKSIKRYGPHNIDIISIIFGTLLGDSHAERRSYKVKKGVILGNTRISFQQENSNMEYLIWLWNYLSERGYATPIKPKVKTRICKNGVGVLLKSFLDFLKYDAFSYKSRAKYVFL